jgi:hypothetical protein
MSHVHWYRIVDIHATLTRVLSIYVIIITVVVVVTHAALSLQQHNTELTAYQARIKSGHVTQRLVTGWGCVRGHRNSSKYVATCEVRSHFCNWAREHQDVMDVSCQVGVGVGGCARATRRRRGDDV